MRLSLFDSMFDSTMRGLEKNLDLTWRRNEALTSNIANAETPQYRAVDLNFSSELERAFEKIGSPQSTVAKTSPKHLDTVTNSGAHLIPDLTGQTRGDGNNVDLDIQMGRLAYNAGKYNMATNLLRKKLTLIKNAIRDARG